VTRSRMALSILVLFLSGLACNTIMGEDSTEIELPSFTSPEPPSATSPETPSATPPELPPAANTASIPSCQSITDRILEVNFASPEQENLENMDFGGRDEDSGTYIATYPVSGDEIGDPYFEEVPADLRDDQDDILAHQQIWEYFTELIPLENREILAEFAIMTDGKENVLAAVAQSYSDPSLWSLEVDIEDSRDRYLLTFTLIHEFAHLLTLGPGQVSPSEAIFNNPEDNEIYLQQASACPNYFPGEGCSNPDSYINAFYNRFWVDIYQEWNEINLEQVDEVYYQRLDQFYISHQDQFVSNYAVTHPAEDIAESFAFFVLSPQPVGDTIAEQKIRFFDEYPELVDLRGQILQDLCESFPE